MPAPSVRTEPFGIGIDGSAVDRYVLDDGEGTRAAVLTHGATLQSVEVPDRAGAVADVTLGFARLTGYTDPGYLESNPYFGATVGRFANRIAGGRFTLDGTEYAIPAQQAGNALHGGPFGFDRRVWIAEPGDGAAVRLALRSPDGDQGFPGTLDVRVTYSLAAGALRIDYEALTDAPTVLNLTNHTYWNLGGEGSGSTDGHELEIPASRHLVLDPASIPTGEIADVAGTPLDFRAPRVVGDRLREDHPALRNALGYDCCYPLESAPDVEGLRLAARLRDPASGRTLEVATSQPAVQLYTANHLTGSLRGASGRQYRQGDGIALETQHYPDAPNHPHFPSTVLRPGDRWRASTVYRFTAG